MPVLAGPIRRAVEPEPRPPLIVSRRICTVASMRRNDHPSRPSAMTCCFFPSLKTLLTLTEGNPHVRTMSRISESVGRFSGDHHWPVLGDPRGPPPSGSSIYPENGGHWAIAPMISDAWAGNRSAGRSSPCVGNPRFRDPRLGSVAQGFQLGTAVLHIFA